MKPFTIAMGGEAGYGIASSGVAVSRIAMRSGYNVYNYFEYPSLIRGGHNFFTVSISEEPVRAPYKFIDLLIALNQETVDRHMKDVSRDGAIMIDSGIGITVPNDFKGKVFDIPIYEMARNLGAVLLKDIAAIGASIYLMNGDIKVLENLIKQEFASKSKEILENNLKIAKEGYDCAKTSFKKPFQFSLKPKKLSSKPILINANQAAAVASVRAGLQFAAIYPMTPTSNILHILAPLQTEYGFIYKQPEDEISAINMAIGASFAGARSMVATSGGGFCLMTEALGLAGITETPIVIIEGMRGGPATGLPTWTEQGDLRFVLHAHQGDFPRIVLAPGDSEEVFQMVMQAFNLAEVYQTPVIVLVDKLLCESNQNFPIFADKFNIERGKFTTKAMSEYLRYKFAENGISLRSPVGVGNYVMANSDEHDEKGFSTEEQDMRKFQMEKRMNKLDVCEQNENNDPILYGKKNAKLTLVSWGSSKGAILEALKYFDNVNLIHLNWINPFPTKKLRSMLLNSKKLVNVEGNYTAQMGGLIAEKTGINIENNILRYDGRPFFVEELVEQIKKFL